MKIRLAALIALASSVLPIYLSPAAAVQAEPAGTGSIAFGSFGAGTATNIGQIPLALAAAGGDKVYVADATAGLTGIVRELDLSTGQERVAFGCCSSKSRLKQINAMASNPGGALYVSSPPLVHELTPGLSEGTIYAGGSGQDADAVPATHANLDPSGLARDNDGGTFISDARSNRIRRVDSSGIIKTVANSSSISGFSGDGGPAGAARFSAPRGLAYSDGNLYVADTGNNRVRKIDASGIVTTIAGSGAELYSGDGGPSLQAGIRAPKAIAVDAAGNLYITQPLDHVIRRVDPTGTISTFAGTGYQGFSGDLGPAAAASLDDPAGLAVVPNHGVVIADRGNLRVRLVDASGTIRTVAGNGESSFGGDGGPADRAQFRKPVGGGFDTQDNYYFGDSFNGRIRKVSAGGIISTVAGNGSATVSGDGGPANNAGLGRVQNGIGGIRDVVVDPTGTVYFSAGNRVRRVDPSGTISTIAGTGEAGFSGDNGPASSAALNNPNGLVLDATGSLYIADTGNHRVRKVTPLGVISTVAGNGTDELWVDGVSPLATSVSNPQAVAVDEHGTLYVFHRYQNTGVIRRLDSGGLIESFAGDSGTHDGGEDLPALRFVDLVNTRQMRFGPNGNLYVAGQWSTLVVITPTGRLYGGGQHAHLPVPMTSLAFDSHGDLYGAGDRYDSAPDSAILRVSVPELLTPKPDDASVWGWNGFGQLGLGDSTDRPLPSGIQMLHGISDISAGHYHNLAVRGDGRVLAWGWNGLGQLGDGTTVDRAEPRLIPGLRDIVAVAAGTFHSLAMDSAGSVWAWGWNGYGQLGNGTVVDSTTPVRLESLQEVVQISAGWGHSVALTSNGRVLAWGWNANGQLGDGTTVNHSSPVQARTFTPNPQPGQPPVFQPSKHISAGGLHTLSALNSGRVMAWGLNAYGELGDGTRLDRSTPVVVPGAESVWTVAAGFIHSLAMRSDGTVKSWGWNGVGQLGDGTVTDRLKPVDVQLGRVVEIGAGFLHSMAVTETDSSRVTAVWTWGWNSNGQLGDGTFVDRLLPAKVAGGGTPPGTNGPGYWASGKARKLVSGGAVHTLIRLRPV